jgi:hypothetical protein
MPPHMGRKYHIKKEETKQIKNNLTVGSEP